MKNNIKHPEPNQLQAFFDQVLDKSDALAILNHLDSCPACREELAHLDLLITRLENLPEFSLQNDLSKSVLTKLQDRKKLSIGLTWTLVVEALAAGAVIGALIPVIDYREYPGVISISIRNYRPCDQYIVCYPTISPISGL